MMMLSIDQEKAVSLVPSIDFINPYKFNMVEQKAFLFLPQLEVLQ